MLVALSWMVVASVSSVSAVFQSSNLSSCPADVPQSKNPGSLHEESPRSRSRPAAVSAHCPAVSAFSNRWCLP